MSTKNATIAEAYYTAISRRDMESVKKYLHQDVRLIGPLFTLDGKEAVVDSIEKFSAFFKTLKVRVVFGSDTQAVVIYDFEFPLPIGNLSSSVLLTFDGDLIKKLELFYDARPFEPKKEEIFSKN